MAGALGGDLGMALGEGLALGPGLEVLFAPPPGVDHVLLGALDGTEQFEALEALRGLHQAGPAGEPALDLLAHLCLDRKNVDLHDAQADSSDGLISLALYGAVAVTPC